MKVGKISQTLHTPLTRARIKKENIASTPGALLLILSRIITILLSPLPP